MKLLHIMPDDKFWQIPILIFDLTKIACEYICFVNDNFVSYNYIKERYVPMKKIELKKYLSECDADVVLFHSMPPWIYDVVLSVPQNKKVVWLSWGFDIYYSYKFFSPIISIDLYKRYTSRNISHVGIMRKVKRKLKKIIFQSRTKEEQRKADVIQSDVLSRVDYCSTVLPIEYELLKEKTGFSAQYFPFQYSSRHRGQQGQIIDVNATSILVGNSCDPSNNHYDIIRTLVKRNIHNQLYLSLAYGNEEYRDRLCQYLDNHDVCYVAQKEMIKFEDYCEELRKCSVAVFGHMRQQAMGNISICLRQGCKVFLYKDSIAYRYLKSIGCFIYSIEDDLYPEVINQRMSTEEIAVNCRSLDLYSIENVLERLVPFLNEMEKKISCAQES